MMRSTVPALCLLACVSFAAAQNLLPNPSFEAGQTQPDGWQLRDGTGAWETTGRTGKRCLSVTGDGKNSHYWFTPMPDLPLMGVYRMSFWARSLPGTSGGCFVTGPSFCNRDYSFTEHWRQYASVLCVPGKYTDAVCRLGQWTVNGTGQFDDVELRPVVPVHNTTNGLTLGEGEETAGTTYRFKSQFSGPGSNYSRCLQSATASFNSSRWCFGPGSEIVYRLQAGDIPQTAAQITVNVGYYQSGTCVVEAAAQPGQWEPVGQISSKGVSNFKLPEKLFPCVAITLRLRSPGANEQAADFAPGSFQVHGLDYEATLAQDAGSVAGSTSFLDIAQATDAVAVEVMSLGTLMPGDGQQATLRVTPRDSGPATASLQIGGAPTSVKQIRLQAGQPQTIALPYSVSGDGEQALTLTLKDGRETLWQAQTSFQVAPLYAADYGYSLGEANGVDLWWCEGTHKVSRERSAPTVRAPVKLAAARNEYEPVQIVLRPRKAVANMFAEIGDFTGPGGARIPKEAFTVKSVEYLKVNYPTDSSATAGWWPDPLPKLQAMALEAGRNYPLWVTLKVPQDARAGLYRGNLTIQTGADVQAVPIQLQVFDFTMPAKSHLTTAWGWSWGRVRQYHNLTDPQDQAKVHDLYLQNFREHRISPYDFSQLAPIKVSVSGVNWNGGKIVQDQAAEGKCSLVINDDSDSRVIAASAAARLPIEKGASYKLSFSARSAEPGQEMLVTLGCFDANGKWFSGRNNDIVLKGTGQWQRHEVTLAPERFPEGCTHVDLTLRPVRWSDKGERVGAAWFDNLYFGKADGGANLIADPSFEIGDDAVQVQVDWTGFDQAATKYIDGYGFNGFRLPLQFLGGGRHPDFRLGRIGPFEEGTPEYERLFAAYAREVQNHLEQKGWLDEAYLYWYDEPEPGDYEFVRRTNERIHKYAPKLNRMLTEEPQPALYGAVDTWCPVTYNYDRQRCQERQSLGEKIWWYVCCGPKAPHAGLFIDHGATDLRVWLWQTWQNKVEGCLIWESTWWDSTGAPNRPQNPWTDPMGWTPDGGQWGNGDGRFLYPANRDFPNDKQPYVEGPVDSIRWEMLREGLEDWEYLYLLNQCIEKKLPGAAAHAALLTVPEDISADLTNFARKPAPIYAHRAKLAAALEKLQVDQLGIK